MSNINLKSYSNIDEAVAFELAFVPLIYTYDSIAPMEYDKYLCSRCRNYEQSRDYLCPKRNFKKDYGLLCSIQRFAVSIEIRNELIELFDVEENDFRPVRNKEGEILAYQITPIHTMLPISDVNRIKKLKPCSKCGAVQYRINEYKNEKGEEFCYISKEALEDMHDINKTFERFDMFIPRYIVSRRVYEYMVQKNPRMRFKPYFLK